MKIGIETRGTEISAMREQGVPSQKTGSEGAKKGAWEETSVGRYKRRKEGVQLRNKKQVCTRWS